MGTVGSKSAEDDDQEQDGGLLHVSLKMVNYKRSGDLIPHLYGSVPLVGSWDATRAVCSMTFLSS